jgi:uncharacterized membrane protein YbaN (DUF454 family)
MTQTKQLHIALRYCLIVIGWLSVVLGVIGIFLPLLPTTPFLLLAVSCFAKSSQRFHDWLLNQPQLGPYIHMYLDGKGIPVKAKAYILIALWFTISTSALFFVKPVALKFLLFAIASGVTIHILRMPTLMIDNKTTAEPIRSE